MRQSKKGELRTPAEELDEIDRGGGGEEREKRDREGRDGEISFTSYSIEAAQLGLRRRTSEKGKHAEALEFGEGGRRTSHRRNCRSKSGFAHFPDFHLN